MPNDLDNGEEPTDASRRTEVRNEPEPPIYYSGPPEQHPATQTSAWQLVAFAAIAIIVAILFYKFKPFYG